MKNGEDQGVRFHLSMTNEQFDGFDNKSKHT